MSEAVIAPIGESQRRQVTERTQDYLQLAGRELGRRFDPVPVLFDLRGRPAGMYRVRHRQPVIRYNPWLFAKYFHDSLCTTVPHEVAHYVVDMVYGLRTTRPHGREWQAVMHLLGAEPCASGDYDLEGIPVRRQRRFDYACHCGSHQLTTVRHRRVQSRCTAYFCRRCRGELVYTG